MKEAKRPSALLSSPRRVRGPRGECRSIVQPRSGNGMQWYPRSDSRSRTRAQRCAGSEPERTLQVLGEILASADSALSAQAVFDRLVARERLGSTGLGEGCALPHARVPGLGRTLAAFLRLRKGVDFDSPDHAPVDLVFGLLVPEESTDEHLEILAAIARVLSDERVRSSIRSAEEPARIREVLIQQRHLHLRRAGNASPDRGPGRSGSRSTMARMCRMVVPQQPPMICTPLSTQPRHREAKSSGSTRTRAR